MTKPHKQTTSAVSSIAGRYARMSNQKLGELANGYFWVSLNGEKAPGRIEAEKFFRDIRKLAASCLAQDQTKGQGKP